MYVNHEVSQSLCISVLCAHCQCNYAIVRVCMCVRLIRQHGSAVYVGMVVVVCIP